MADLSDVGVVVVTYNSAVQVPHALRALPLAELHGVVVVDNGSSDGTAEQVQRLGLPGVRVVAQQNVGFGAGCNTGLRALPQARRVLLLNPDAVLPEAGLRRLVGYLDDHPAAAVVAPRLWQGGEPLTSAGALATSWTELRFALPPFLARLVRDRRLPPTWDRSGPVGVVEGACMLVDAEAVRAVGGFDSRYFLFFEEHDLARRLARQGRELHLCAEARAQHAVGASRADTAVSGHDHYWTSTVTYLKRWGPRGGARLVAAAARLGWAWSRLRGRLAREDAARLRQALTRAGGRS